MNVAARKIVGTNISARREILYTMADVRTAQNHYILKSANLLDRVLRATGTAAQVQAQEYVTGTEVACQEKGAKML